MTGFTSKKNLSKFSMVSNNYPIQKLSGLNDVFWKYIFLSALLIIFFGSDTSPAKVPVRLNKVDILISEYEARSIVYGSFEKGIRAKHFYKVIVDDDNTKWFLTENGIASFDGKKWNLYNKIREIPKENLKDIAYGFTANGKVIWIATPQGAKMVPVPINKKTGVMTYNTENTSILSNNILEIAVGKNLLHWFGTESGISALSNDKWLTNSYQRKYRESMFKEFPITSMSATPYGDTLYVGTEGAGVARLYRNKVDGISGASEYARWGPINMPSDRIYSICITPDGTQWFGTDRGVTRHSGYQTLRNWSVFNTGNGLINNFAQTISLDKEGNIWVGTRGGVSVYDGKSWRSMTEKDGLCSNNILCIATDRDGVIWIGTDNGVMRYTDGEMVTYR